MAFSNSSVLVLDDNGMVVSHQTGQSSPYNFNIPAGVSGVWSWVVARRGYTPQLGTFDMTGGGIRQASPTPSIELQPDGSPLYSGTTTPLITVSFSTGPARCFIDIGDGTVSAQQVVDAIEEALETQAGCVFLAQTNGAQTSFAVLGGQTYLLLGAGYRLRRRNAADVNATVSAFASSSDGQSIDGANGTVQLLAAPEGLTAEDVWNYLESAPTVQGSMKYALQTARDHGRATNAQTQNL